jgi:hypothetical protein
MTFLFSEDTQYVGSLQVEGEYQEDSLGRICLADGG